ncbi:MAG: Rrf2 family transcriptional regulator [Candidatus Aureabacteria bacterium]|nr:Rrf2 family transcriptional regulator [Candidatus Auribacterota bacterium]
MKLITRDTDYAVRALGFIAKNKGDVTSVRDMVDALKIPRPFLRKILQILQKKGVLESFKGKGGGFQLAIPADQIYLTDIMEAFQGPLKMTECLFRKKLCPHVKSCPLKSKIDNIQRYVARELRSVTLSEVLI